MSIKEKEAIYQVCTKCILDSQDPAIHFDENGVCNYCHNYEVIAKKALFIKKDGEKKLSSMIEEIKQEGKGKQYDCLLGVSGGIDSTYLAYHVKKWGLRPLIFHFDNGWNSELAVKNVEEIVSQLGFDLYTYVVDWEEFRDLQRSYFKANVLDLDVPTDHGIAGAQVYLAKKFKIKYILTGHNVKTEAILPRYMIWSKLDLLNLKSIHKKFGTKKLKTFPTVSFQRNWWLNTFKKIVLISPLNYIDYNKDTAKKTVMEELNWRDYGAKHYENIFTRFFQGYILPQKCHIDKRKAHLSTMISAGMITRDEALKEIAMPPYNPEELRTDKEFVLKKLEFTEEWFEEYIQTPPRSHLDFPSYTNRHYKWHLQFFKYFSPLIRPFKGIILPSK